MRRQKRSIPISWLLAALTVLAAPAASLVPLHGVTYAQSLNQVALIVQYGDGTTFTRCVEFAEEQITGLDVLQRAGLDLVYASGGGGAEVCKIGPDGCDNPGDCWCQCKGKDCQYWSYWHLVDGAWRYSPFGASLYKVRHGAVEGWVWGIGTPTEAPQPPAIAFGEICLPPTATRVPQDQAAPTPTPAALATATPTPLSPTLTPELAPTEGTEQSGDPELAEGTEQSGDPELAEGTERSGGPTPTATHVPQDRSAPTPTPAAPATATAAPLAPTPTLEPAPSVKPEPEPAQDAAWGSYLAFGGIVVVLAVVGLVVLRKR